MHNYDDVREHIDPWFERMYNKALCLVNTVVSEKERPRTNARQIHRDNIPADTTKEYWKRVLAIPFLDIVSCELNSRFSHEKRAHYELCALIPTVIRQKDENGLMCANFSR